MSRPISFRQVDAFRAVMLTGTTIAAAEMLRTTQPSISRLLSQLQAATRVRLFELVQGRLQPTPEAAQLFEAVQRNFLGLEKIEDAIKAIQRSGTGALRIACTPTLGISFAPKAIAAFQQQHPDVHIVFPTVGSHYIRDGLLNGLYDLALTTNRFPGHELQTEIVDSVSAVAVMSPSHPLARKGVIDPAHFADETLLTLDAMDDLSDRWRRVLADRKVTPRSTIETTYSATICTLASASVGIGVVNPYIASVFADRLHIAALKPEITVEAVVTRPRNRTVSSLAEPFIAVLKAQFAKQNVSRAGSSRSRARG